MPRKAIPFWNRVKGTGHCWLWTGCRNDDGYGVVRFNGGMCKAHVVAWFLTNGLIPDGLDVLHECDNPPCVNPDHLFLGTNADNCRDRQAKGRTKNLELGPLAQASKTHCPAGHAYTPENTRIRSSGSRDCLACKRKEQQHYLEKSRAAHNARRRTARAARSLR